MALLRLRTLTEFSWLYSDNNKVNMSKVIIYPTINNQIAVIIPVTSELTIEEIALKDVPFGSKYLIIDAIQVPTDRSQRQAWTADFTSALTNTGSQP